MHLMLGASPHRSVSSQSPQLNSVLWWTLLMMRSALVIIARKIGSRRISSLLELCSKTADRLGERIDLGQRTGPYCSSCVALETGQPLLDPSQRRLRVFWVSSDTQWRGSLLRSFRAFFNARGEDALGVTPHLPSASSRFLNELGELYSRWCFCAELCRISSPTTPIALYYNMCGC